MPNSTLLRNRKIEALHAPSNGLLDNRQAAQLVMRISALKAALLQAAETHEEDQENEPNTSNANCNHSALHSFKRKCKGNATGMASLDLDASEDPTEHPTNLDSHADTSLVRKKALITHVFDKKVNISGFNSSQGIYNCNYVLVA